MMLNLFGKAVFLKFAKISKRNWIAQILDSVYESFASRKNTDFPQNLGSQTNLSCFISAFVTQEKMKNEKDFLKMIFSEMVF